MSPHRSTQSAGSLRPAAAAAAALAGLAALAGCGRVQPDPTAALARNAISTPPPIATTTTTALPDPGLLPQTLTRPSTADPAFVARIQVLWQAVVDGQPGDALSAFFPLNAYLQVKAVTDPANDWRTRLVANFDQDIDALHTVLSSAAGPATFVGISVPTSTAVLVRPGVEFNRLTYWRVYNSRVEYRVAGVVKSFVIASMISWRGQWYVVHLSSIR